ncbi:MAG: SMC-Scp complex subunit ScpB [Thermoanaerobaculia bacterium]
MNGLEEAPFILHPSSFCLKTMEANELRAALEAILFLSSEPVKVDDLAESLEESKEAVQAQLEEVKRILDEHVGGFTLEQAAGGWRLTTRAEHDGVLKKYFAKKGENRLSLAALETLAIVAYRQPITAPEIGEIRGVNSGSAIRTLLERRMIRVAGRKNVVGSPFLYRTTRDFLVHFGLNDIRDLPRLEEFGDLIGENIGDDLVAAINAAPEPSGEGILEAAPENDVEAIAESIEEDTGTTFEEQVAVAPEENQLESSRSSEPIEE